MFPVVGVYDDRLDALEFCTQQAYEKEASVTEDIEVEFDLEKDIKADEIVAGDLRFLVIGYPVE